MFGEELLDAPQAAPVDLLGQVHGVRPAFKPFIFKWHVQLFELPGQQVGLRNRHRIVDGPVEDQRRRGVSGQVADGGGLAVLGLRLLVGLTAHELDHHAGVSGGIGGQIGRAVEIDHGLYATAHAGVAAFTLQRLHPRGVPDHHGQMPARGASEHADLLGVHAVLRGVRPEPADGALGVLHGGRIGGVCGQAIGHGGGHVALLGQFDAVVVVDPPLAALPPATMDEDQRRDRLVGPLGLIEVELEWLIVDLAVFEVGFPGDTRRHGDEQVDELDPVLPDGLLHFVCALVAGRSLGRGAGLRSGGGGRPEREHHRGRYEHECGDHAVGVGVSHVCDPRAR